MMTLACGMLTLLRMEVFYCESGTLAHVVSPGESIGTFCSFACTFLVIVGESQEDSKREHFIQIYSILRSCNQHSSSRPCTATRVESRYQRVDGLLVDTPVAHSLWPNDMHRAAYIYYPIQPLLSWHFTFRSREE